MRHFLLLFLWSVWRGLVGFVLFLGLDLGCFVLVCVFDLVWFWFEVGGLVIW